MRPGLFAWGLVGSQALEETVRYGNLPLGLNPCLHRRLTLHSIPRSSPFGAPPDAEPRVNGLHRGGFVPFQGVSSLLGIMSVTRG